MAAHEEPVDHGARLALVEIRGDPRRRTWSGQAGRRRHRGLITANLVDKLYERLFGAEIPEGSFPEVIEQIGPHRVSVICMGQVPLRALPDVAMVFDESRLH